MQLLDQITLSFQFAQNFCRKAMSRRVRFDEIRGETLLYYAISSNINDFSEALELLGITSRNHTWGHSSAGRAPAWHAGGQRFEPAWLHLTFNYSIYLYSP